VEDLGCHVGLMDASRRWDGRFIAPAPA